MIKNKIKIIFFVIIGMIIASSISVYATYNYLASDVSYRKQDGMEMNVEEALNDLYANKNAQKMENLKLVADLTTGNISRVATITTSFQCEANEEYYMIGNYLNGGVGSTTATTSIRINSIVNKISLNNAIILEQYADLDMVKIQSNDKGIVTITMDTGVTNSTAYLSKLALKIYK